MVESGNQLIKNPLLKEKKVELKKLKTQLTKLYKKQGQIVTKRKQKKQSNEINRQIEELENKIEALRISTKKLPEKVDVTTLQDYRSIKAIDNEGKRLFDFCTTSIWNARKNIVSMLKEFYSQKNDIVDLFYAIASCQGYIKVTDNEVFVKLEPLENIKRKSAQIQLCRKLSNRGVQLPNGKYLRIEVDQKNG